jgi:proteasome accessory factor A
MATESILGTETELGITSRMPADFDPVSSSIGLINALDVGVAPRVIWDYAGENPLVDARGYEVTGERERPSLQDNRAINKLLLNGGRLYIDGAHPEYSTPETTSARDLVVFEKAGERIADRCREIANRSLPPHQQLVLYKNNSDGKGNSYGYHENYLVSRRVPFDRLVEALTPFLVSRIVIAGAGKVGSENGAEPCAYQLSQRADFFETLIGLDTMAKRPIINTRDEPHADEERYRRLHVIVGDSNMAEVSTYLKVGTTALVLAMVEDGALRRDLTLEDPVRAIKEISHDTTCTRKVRLKRGGERSAIELQREYLELAHAYYATIEPSPQVTDLLARWERVLTQLAEEPRQCARELDWVIKRELIESYMARKGIGFDDQRISMLDLQYHDLRLDKGLYYRLEQQGLVDRLVTDEEIRRAMAFPPTDTRAYFRGTCLRKYPESVYGASWTSVLLDVDDRVAKRIPMADPTRGTRKLVGEVLERSETVAELVERLAG